MPGGSDRCPECGAPVVDALDCRAKLGVVTAWEVDDPALGALHFLTVASFNLQHPAAFADEALAVLRAAFVDHLDRGTATPELLRRVRARFDGSTRVMREASERRPVRRDWELTIDAVHGPGPAGAPERVRRWAESIRRTFDGRRKPE